MEKETKIKTEYLRLSELYKNLAPDRRKLAEKLISNAAYMSVVLEDLQETVKSEGAIITSTNGNGFSIMQEHPAQKSYNIMISRFSNLMKQLGDLLPEGTQTESKLEQFLNSNE